MRKAVIAATFALILLGVWTYAALADGEKPRLEDVQIKVDFPQGIMFKVVASSPSGIDEIKVNFHNRASKSAAYGYLDLFPSGEGKVEGEWLLKTGGGAFIPPGTEIYYSIEVSDKAGNVLATKEQTLLYMDDRFEWQTHVKGIVKVYYYGPTEKRAQIIADAAMETITNMGPLLGLKSVSSINVVAYNNVRHMISALPPRSRAQEQELITEGQAWGEFGVLLVLGQEETVKGTTSHELTHMLVHQALPDVAGAIPTWLNEGLAEYGNIDPGITFDQALRYGVYTRQIKPLWHLERFPGDPDETIIAYGQARSVVRYLVEVPGKDKMPRLFQALNRGTRIDDALMEVYGFDQYGLDTQWRRAMGLKPLPPREQVDRELRSGETQTEATPPSAPEATPATPVEAKPKAKRQAFGCTRQARNDQKSAGLSLDISGLALLATPASLVGWRWRATRRRKGSSARPGVQDVVEGIAQEVEGKDDEGDGAHRKEE